MPPTPKLYTRRDIVRTFAGGAGLLALSGYAPEFLVGTLRAGEARAEQDRPILVLVQLAGGNDGLNTLVPYANDEYARLRPTLRLKPGEVLRIDDQLGLHPSLESLRPLYDEGSLAIVQNVGYPNPDRSHFRSMEIWESASDSDAYESTGWVGRFFDHHCSGTATGSPSGVHFTAEHPPCLVGQKSIPTFGVNPTGPGNLARRRELELASRLAAIPLGSEESAGTFLQHSMMDMLVTEKKVDALLTGYRPASGYPAGPFAHALQGVAALVAARMPTRVYFVSLGGFDTHANQANTHAQLLRTLSEGLAAFQRDLEAKGLAEQVLTMTFSEFGRRASENRSRGTDHGTAAPLLILGRKAKGGLHGRAPDLKLEANQDLQFSTDFRAVYSDLLRDWLGANSAAVLGRDFSRLGVIQT